MRPPPKGLTVSFRDIISLGNHHFAHNAVKFCIAIQRLRLRRKLWRWHHDKDASVAPYDYSADQGFAVLGMPPKMERGVGGWAGIPQYLERKRSGSVVSYTTQLLDSVPCSKWSHIYVVHLLQPIFVKFCFLSAFAEMTFWTAVLVATLLASGVCFICRVPAHVHEGSGEIGVRRLCSLRRRLGEQKWLTYHHM